MENNEILLIIYRNECKKYCKDEDRRKWKGMKDETLKEENMEEKRQ